MTMPVSRGRWPVPAYFAPVLILVLTLGVLLGASVRAGAAPYAAMVMDARTGEVLHSRNADTRLHPASLTKMMTLYVAFEAVRHGEIGLDDRVTISRKAAAEVPSKLGLRAGSQIEFRYLIRASAVKSANDAATAIGEAVSGSEAAFARRMNRTAKALGMTRTTFKNAHGLTEEGHLSTARDMTILGRRLFYDYPEYYNLFSRRATDAKLATVYNTNRRFLAAYKGADGIKTGYTRAAGFNLVASAERGRERIIATVFGGNSTATRNAEVARLLDMGFDRAPRIARVRKPALPPYIPPEADAAPVAVAGTSGRMPAGKTIRVVRAVKKTLRPMPRPGMEPAPEVLLALQDGVSDAVGQALAAAEPLTPLDPPNEAADETAEAVAEVVEDAAAPVIAAVEAPPARPDGLAEIAVAAVSGSIDPPKDAAEAEAAETPEADEAPAEAMQIAEAASPAPDAPSPAVPRVEASASGALTKVAAQAAKSAAPRAAAFLRTAARETAPAGAPPVAPPPARPDDITLASAVPPGAIPASDAEAVREIVARVSTSGGRHWGITLGNYASRFAAERDLLRTALSEMQTLDGALRKVARGGGGYQANFVGMTEDQAALACRRLTARGRSCETLGPS